MPLTDPEALHKRLTKRWRNQRGRWLCGDGQWPLGLALGVPTQQQARDHWPAVEAWITAWRRSPLAPWVEWQARQWPGLGRQDLPTRLLLATPGEVAAVLGQADAWRRLTSRFSRLSTRWPALTERLAAEVDWLDAVAEADLDRLIALLDWLKANPGSGLYPRQIPLAGLDTKWLEAHRGRVLRWWQVLHTEGEGEGDDIYQSTGLRPPPLMVPIKLLDQRLAARLGGVHLLHLERDALAALDWQPEEVLIVENQQTGWALESRQETVAIFGLGMAIERLAGISWLARARLTYWGDIDTHGFAILDRLRAHYPKARSLLMDETTLEEHLALAVTEPTPTRAALTRLTVEENEVYRGLLAHRWGDRLRLEQERLSWNWVREKWNDI